MIAGLLFLLCALLTLAFAVVAGVWAIATGVIGLHQFFVRRRIERWRRWERETRHAMGWKLVRAGHLRAAVWWFENAGPVP